MSETPSSGPWVVNQRFAETAEEETWIELTDEPALPGWRFRLYFVGPIGELTAVELRVADAAREKLASPALRKVRLGALELAARKYATSISSALEQAENHERNNWVRIEGDKLVRDDTHRTWTDYRQKVAPQLELVTIRPGRAGHDERKLALIARDYVEAVDGRVPRVTAFLASRYGYSESGMRDLIRSLRKKHGLLTDTKRGIRGGDLTPKANRLLAEED